MEPFDAVRLPVWFAGGRAYEAFPREARPFGGRLLLAGGRRALKAGRGRLEAAIQGRMALAETRTLEGCCSMAEAEALADAARGCGAELLCGMGGGRALDTVKAAGDLAGLPVFTFPTIAATCAAVTALSVMHGEDGAFSALYPLKRPPVAAFIDTAVLAAAPARYLRAGLGDSLGKGVEPAFSSRGRALRHSDALALSMAGGLIGEVERQGPEALRQAEEGRAGEALTDMALLNIVSVGCVSLLIREEYNCALAHSLSYTLEGLPQLKGSLHGELVAWGAAVQLQMDGQGEEALRVLRLLRALGIPASLAAMGADLGEEAVSRAIRAAAFQSDMATVPYPVSPEMILAAAQAVERAAGEV